MKEERKKQKEMKDSLTVDVEVRSSRIQNMIWRTFVTVLSAVGTDIVNII